MLTIYNTLTGKKELFQPLVQKTVRMYVCGVTVYDYCHLGHACSALVFDVIRRYLEYAGYTVEFVKNLTDVQVFHNAGGVYDGTDEPYLFGRLRVSGPDPEHRSYRSFASFRDPDGNGWLVQEVTTRLPGRIL